MIIITQNLMLLSHRFLEVMNTLYCPLLVLLNRFLDIVEFGNCAVQAFYDKYEVLWKVFCGSQHILMVSNLKSKSTIILCQLLYPLRKIWNRQFLRCL